MCGCDRYPAYRIVADAHLFETAPEVTPIIFGEVLLQLPHDLSAQVLVLPQLAPLHLGARLELEDGHHCVVVAASAAQVLHRLHSGRRHVHEAVVDAAQHVARLHVHQALAQLLHHLGGAVRVEVTQQHDHITSEKQRTPAKMGRTCAERMQNQDEVPTGLTVLLDDPEQVPGCPLAAATAARVDSQGAMEIRQEDLRTSSFGAVSPPCLL